MVLVVTVFLGVNSNMVNAASEPQDGAYRQINVYSEVLRHIQTDYVVDPNINDVTNGALRGPAGVARCRLQLPDRNRLQGLQGRQRWQAQVGLNVSKRFGYATVVSVVPGSPGG